MGWRGKMTLLAQENGDDQIASARGARQSQGEAPEPGVRQVGRRGGIPDPREPADRRAPAPVPGHEHRRHGRVPQEPGTLPEVRSPQPAQERRAIRDARAGVLLRGRAAGRRGDRGLLREAGPERHAEVLRPGHGRGQGRPPVPEELRRRPRALPGARDDRPG